MIKDKKIVFAQFSTHIYCYMNNIRENLYIFAGC